MRPQKAALPGIVDRAGLSRRRLVAQCKDPNDEQHVDSQAATQHKLAA